MNSQLRRTLRGPFLAQESCAGVWHLATSSPRRVDIYLQGVASDAALAAAATYDEIILEWQGSGVEFWLVGAGHVQSLAARGAVIHQPLAQLYDALPLQNFDPRARRFWRRIFRIVRIPGGRHLLHLFARGIRRRGRPV